MYDTVNAAQEQTIWAISQWLSRENIHHGLTFYRAVSVGRAEYWTRSDPSLICVDVTPSGKIADVRSY